MKNYLLISSLVLLLGACSTEKSEPLVIKTDMVPVHTAESAISNTSTDIGETDVPEAEHKTAVRKKNTGKAVLKHNQDMSKKADNLPVTNEEERVTANETVNQPKQETVKTNPDVVQEKGETASAGNSTSHTEKVTKKKGWSDAAKGAAIGGAAGAIGGAVINGRNRGAGAVIGAVIGAAGGYVIGRKMDKKKEADRQELALN